MTARKYSLLGGEVSITVRYGWAIIQNIEHQTAAITVPTIGRWRMQFDLVSWHETYDDAMAMVAAMHLSGMTPEDWKARKRRERKQAKKGSGAQPEGGGGEPLQIEAGPPGEGSLTQRLAAALARASRLPTRVVDGHIVVGEPVADGGA